MRVTRVYRTSKSFVLALVLLALCGSAMAESRVVLSSETSSGIVASGMVEITFIFSTDFTGSVQGAPFNGATDSSVRFRAREGDTLSAIKYIVSTGSVRIVRLF